MQGATMFLGPFGYGITAFEFIHQSGGNLARVSAIEQISQAKTQPMHKELLTALGDKDAAVRVAAAKALVDYHDKATSMALYALFSDSKYPVRLTSAAAYLRTTGTPGPPVTAIMASSVNTSGSEDQPLNYPYVYRGRSVSKDCMRIAVCRGKLSHGTSGLPRGWENLRDAVGRGDAGGEC